jgi:pyruvate/2-oxoglutarate dehydrogenase complex dihydrolipoamide acyltransferase (E2) component
VEPLTISIPQLGEGLQEATIIQFYKQAGDSVARDEPLYQMETDKALVVVEAPCAGTVEEWLCKEGSILPIGTPVARIKPHEQSAGASAWQDPRAIDGYLLKSRPSWRGVVIGEPTLKAAADAPSKALPETQSRNGVQAPAPKNARLVEISPRQRILWNRMKQGAAMAVPALVRSNLDYKAVKAALKQAQTEHQSLKLTAFEFFAFLVSRAAIRHPKFLLTIGANEALYIHDGLNLGVAVAMKDDELATAVVKDADKLDIESFTSELRKAVRTARRGQDQADDTVQLLLSSLGSYHVHDATPVIVPPAIATLFFGSPFLVNDSETMTLSLTFDHRAINGVGAGAFLKEVAGLLVNGR